LRRLYSTFAPGWPGVGLLLMRLVAGGALMAHGFTRFGIEPSIQNVLAVAAGIVLLVGLWTPIAGALAAVLALWHTISQPGDRWTEIFLGTICVALALVGPGAWSVDARLFGWKRIDFRGPQP
jgi:uncharacterized membrane protein YphA (DoxX/SURF4 family)